MNIPTYLYPEYSKYVSRSSPVLSLFDTTHTHKEDTSRWYWKLYSAHRHDVPIRHTVWYILIYLCPTVFYAYTNWWRDMDEFRYRIGSSRRTLATFCRNYSGNIWFHINLMSMCGDFKRHTTKMTTNKQIILLLHKYKLFKQSHSIIWSWFNFVLKRDLYFFFLLLFITYHILTDLICI